MNDLKNTEDRIGHKESKVELALATSLLVAIVGFLVFMGAVLH